MEVGGQESDVQNLCVETLEMIPPPPIEQPASSLVVLGRFQPFHKGHEFILRRAMHSILSESEHSVSALTIAIGSTNRPLSRSNPWTFEQRREMVATWLTKEAPPLEVKIVGIPDLGDPPNWVNHAEQYHGPAGKLLTSDENTASLYLASGWDVVWVNFEERDTFEGWRVRETIRMLSTVLEFEGIKEVLGASIPRPVVDLIVERGWHRILAKLDNPAEPHA